MCVHHVERVGTLGGAETYRPCEGVSQLSNDDRTPAPCQSIYTLWTWCRSVTFTTTTLCGILSWKSFLKLNFKNR